MIFLFIIGRPFRKYKWIDPGNDCEANKVITTEGECKEAAKYLNNAYLHATKGFDIPAGCFLSMAKLYFLFNTIIDPSKTNPTGPFSPNVTYAVCRT